jgi:hypothetical protein
MWVEGDDVRLILGEPQFTVKGYKAFGRQEFRIAASASHRVCFTPKTYPPLVEISTWFFPQPQRP